MTTQTVSKPRKRRKVYESPEAALKRIQSMEMSSNDVFVIEAFAAAGVPPEDIDPRVNVLTFNCWKALGRRVAKGATSLRVTVWIPMDGKAKADPKPEPTEDGKKASMRPTTARLFHISQTVAADAEPGTKPEAWQNETLVKPGSYDDVEPTTEPEPAETPASEPQEPQQPAPAAEQSNACTCPAPGLVTNVNCPVHELNTEANSPEIG